MARIIRSSEQVVGIRIKKLPHVSPLDDIFLYQFLENFF